MSNESIAHQITPEYVLTLLTKEGKPFFAIYADVVTEGKAVENSNGTLNDCMTKAIIKSVLYQLMKVGKAWYHYNVRVGVETWGLRHEA